MSWGYEEKKKVIPGNGAKVMKKVKTGHIYGTRPGIHTCSECCNIATKEQELGHQLTLH